MLHSRASADVSVNQQNMLKGCGDNPRELEAFLSNYLFEIWNYRMAGFIGIPHYL